MERGLWLGRFVDPVAIRKEAALHLYTCCEAEDGERRLVLLGAPGTETSSVAATLDAIAAGHQRVDHPRVPRVVARARVGEIEYLALACDAVIDFSQLQGEIARRPERLFQYGKGVAVYRTMLDVLAVAHEVHDPVYEGPLCLGRWSWANVLLSRDAKLWLIGFGRPRRSGTPWLIPEVHEVAAPEVKLATKVAPSADLFALFMLVTSSVSMVTLPPMLERIMLGQPQPGDAEVERLFNAYQNAQMALSPRDRHQSVAEVVPKLEELMRGLEVKIDVHSFQTLSAGLVQELVSGQQATTAGQGTSVERLDVPACVAGRYRVGKLLGEGGMGRVFRAWDRQLGQPVALKVATLAGSPDHERRFLREVRIARQVRHPHLVHGYDLVREDGQLFAVMELIDGERLDVHFGRTPALAGAAALTRLAEVADALASLHGMGVVHRDVKPSNILVSSERGAVLLDYGVASETGSDLTRTGAALGTPQFMAPEQASGEPVGPSCDVFALGVIARALVTEPAPGLAALLARCTARDPEARPPSIEVAQALHDAARALGGPAVVT